MSDLISRQAAIDCVSYDEEYTIECLKALPTAEPQYEELTPEEFASEIASGSILSARYWLDVTIRLKQRGYAICRKR